MGNEQGSTTSCPVMAKGVLIHGLTAANRGTLASLLHALAFEK